MQPTPQAEPPTSAQNVSTLPLLPSTDTPPSTVASSCDALRLLPDHVLTNKVFTFFGFKDYALAACAGNYLQAHWQTSHRRKPLPLYVPEDCTTLNEAVNRVAQDQRITTILLGQGDHHIDGKILNTLRITSAVNIVGRPDVPREKIVVVGGIHFKKGIQGKCHLQHLTLRQAKEWGVFGQSSFTMEDVLVEQCDCGVAASGTGIAGRCSNVEVCQCGGDGVHADNSASIIMIGAKTTVHHNCTEGHSWDYGLNVVGHASTIQLVSPLTKEHVSIDNGGGGNWVVEEDEWGEEGEEDEWGEEDKEGEDEEGEEDKEGEEGESNADNKQIKTMTKTEFAAVLHQEVARESRIAAASQKIKATGTANVPEDCGTLKEAMEAVNSTSMEEHFAEGRPIIIVVGRGEHQIDGRYLKITSAMSIVGQPDVPNEKIVVVGGIAFEKGIEGNCHLQHLTLRQAKRSGVYGESSFTMKDVIVEQCGTTGVFAWGAGVVGRCTNVKVRQCGESGVVASDGTSITLIGAKTTVHHNCTTGYHHACGLGVDGPSSTIQLVSPLTKEIVSTDNGGGGNWGSEGGADIDQIKTIDAPASSSSSADVGETKSIH